MRPHWKRLFSALGEALRRPLAHGEAVAMTLWATGRLVSLDRRLAFDDLVERLRAGGGWHCRRADPIVLARVVGFMAPLLPPWRTGYCMKRSLLLLQLWSAQGLEPRLHLGVRRASLDAGSLEGHAWLSVDVPELAEHCGSAAGCAETLVL